MKCTYLFIFSQFEHHSASCGEQEDDGEKGEPDRNHLSFVAILDVNLQVLPTCSTQQIL